MNRYLSLLIITLTPFIQGCPGNKPLPPKQSVGWKFVLVNPPNGSFTTQETEGPPTNLWVKGAITVKVRLVPDVPGSEEYLVASGQPIESFAFAGYGGCSPYPGSRDLWFCSTEALYPPSTGLGKYMGFRCGGPGKHIPFSHTTGSDGGFSCLLEFNRRKNNSTDLYPPLSWNNHLEVHVVYRCRLDSRNYVYGGFIWGIPRPADGCGRPNPNFNTCSMVGPMSPVDAKAEWEQKVPAPPPAPQFILFDAIPAPPAQDCGCGFENLDTDGDGTLDCNDLCPLNPFKFGLGACGCDNETDLDGDGVADCVDACPSNPTTSLPPCFSHDGDLDNSDSYGYVNDADMQKFASYYLGSNVPVSPASLYADFDEDGDVDMEDFGILQRCYTGFGPKIPNCIDDNR